MTMASVNQIDSQGGTMIYTDERISDTFADVGFSEYAAMSYGLAVSDAQKMRDDYEAVLATQAAEIAQLKETLRDRQLTVDLRDALVIELRGTIRRLRDEVQELQSALSANQTGE